MTITADPLADSQASTSSSVDNAPASSDAIPPSTRLVSLDAYRGFVMLLMASEGLGIARFVRDHPDHATRLWQRIADQTQHVEWRGCALWDLIQPSFTFIVGVAMPFSLAKRRAQGQGFARLLFHALVRSVILIWLGFLLRSIGRPQTYYTFEDTLTQIGLGYTFAFLLTWLRPRWQATAVAILLVGYWLAFALWRLPPDGFDYAKVGVSQSWLAQHGLHGFALHWGKNTNAAAAFDVRFLNLFPRSRPFAFNGGGYLTLSFIPTLATMLLGLLAGELLRAARIPAGKKILVLLAGGAVGLGLGMLLDWTGVCPNVKRIWTPSWVLFSGGWCCLLLAAFYAIVDLARLRAWAFPLVVVGMNSIAMYCLADAGFRSFVKENFHLNVGRLEWYKTITGPYGDIVEWCIALLVLWLVCLWMYRRKIFLRI
jgi:predicted acyltransferase